MTFIRSFLLTAALAGFASNAFAQATAPAASPAVTRAELPALVKEAILNDPAIVMQALEKLRAEKEAKAKEAAAANLAKYKTDIYSNPNIPSTGAADGDVTIVEFFDYHCGYCKHFLPELNKLIAEDKKVRALFIELPILSEDSATAARAAIAVHRLDKTKYFAFHQALMNEKGKFDEAKLIEVAGKIGIKADALKAEMAKPEVTAVLDKNRQIAEALDINGTPGLIIGNEVFGGAMSFDELKKEVAKARGGKAPAAAPAPAAPAKAQ